MRLFNLILGFVLFSGAFLPVWAFENDSLTLDDLDSRTDLSYSLVSLGGHQEYCIRLTLANSTFDSIGVFIEPGRILLSENEGFQDLVVMRSLHFRLAGRSQVDKDLYAFCCRAKRASPAKNSSFRNGHVDLSVLGLLGNFVNLGNYPANEIQSSVWAISDNYPIASICDFGTNKISPVKNWLASKLNKPVPWHCIEYDIADTSVMRNNHLRVTGKFSFNVPHYSTVTIQVRTNNGRIVNYLQKDAIYNAGNYDFPLDLDVKGWPKGVYEIVVYEDGNRINRPTFFDL